MPSLDSPDGAQSAPGSGERLHLTFAAYRSALDATAELAAAELRLAASSGVLLLALTLVMALLLAGSWIVGMLALAAAFADTSHTWAVALAGVAAANLIAAGIAWWWVRALVPNLTFRELRRLLLSHQRPAAPGRGG